MAEKTGLKGLKLLCFHFFKQQTFKTRVSINCDVFDLPATTEQRSLELQKIPITTGNLLLPEQRFLKNYVPSW